MTNLTDQLKQQQTALSSFKNQPVTENDNLITGVSVPVSLQRNGGKLRMQIHLNASVLESPEALDEALSSLEAVFDLDVWKSKTQDSGGFKGGQSNYRNNNNNNYNNNNRRY